jgi:hypothetical protein
MGNYKLNKIVNTVEYRLRFLKFRANTVLFERFNTASIVNLSTNANVSFQGITLVPGQQFEIGGNFGEVNYQQYNIDFIETGGAATFLCVVTLKNYV